MKDFARTENVGEPDLPVKYLKLIIPSDMDVSSIDVKIESKVTGVYETRTIGNTTYDSVFVTKSTFEGKTALIPTWVPCGTIEMWFKKGVGVIKTNFNISILSFISKKTVVELIDYHIEAE